MRQSLSKLYTHLTFSTKDRYTFIQQSWENKLYAYMSVNFSGIYIRRLGPAWRRLRLTTKAV
jgi:hypothetical protein